MRFAMTSRTATLLAVARLAGGTVAVPSAGTGYALSPDVTISLVYGGGGNSGATLTNDIVEPFNRGETTVELAGWSVR